MSSRYRNRQWWFLIKSEKGSVVIEFFFYFFSIVLLCLLLIDYGRFFLNKGYMERVNHSLASVLRERTVFYRGEEITQDDIDQLDMLAKRLLDKSRIGEEYNLYVDAIYFDDDSKSERKIKGKPISFTADNKKDVYCQKSDFAKDVTKLISLSPSYHTDTSSTQAGRWLPVYQVTLCTQGQNSLLMKILNSIGVSIGNGSVSNAVVPR